MSSEWLLAVITVATNILLFVISVAVIRNDVKWIKEKINDMGTWFADHDKKDDERFTDEREARHKLADQVHEQLLQMERDMRWTDPNRR